MRAGRLIYAVDFGGVGNLNPARLPMFARVDLRVTWRPRGAQGRWELYAEVINLLNRQNAGALEAELEYDPASDRRGSSSSAIRASRGCRPSDSGSGFRRGASPSDSPTGALSTL